MSTSTVRRVVRRIGKALMWVVASLLVLAVAGATYQAIATERAERAYPPPGELVGVGDHETHIDCAGEASPTVVLEAALGNMSANWVRVQQEVSDTTRVCSYDRAGMGWSERGPEPRDAEQVTEELHALLNDTGIEGPYVVVGHSYGGLYARTYAARYPDEVAGVVLVESSHPEQFSRLPQGEENYEQTRRLFAVAPLLARPGVIRLFDLNPVPAELPAQQRAQIDAFNPSTRQVATTADEFRATDQTTTQVRGAGSLSDKPLAVVGAGEQPSAWLALQEELAAISSNSIHRVVEGATHVSLLHEREDARATSAAILEVVGAVRDDRPLTRSARSRGEEEHSWETHH
jgi:pimeloyl-ACP methyl ester carboxylesterase